MKDTVQMKELKNTLPEGWEVKRLEEVCEIELGKTPYRKERSYWDIKKETSNIWLSIADLQNTKDKYIYDSKEYITDKAALISKIVKKGTLLLSFKLTVGRLAFAGRDLFTNEAIAALNIKGKLYKYYLYYYLLNFDWKKITEGESKVKGKTLNKAKLKDLPVIIPPFPEQQRIVAVLDRAFGVLEEAREQAGKNLENARELFESYLNRIFEKKGAGWVEKKLGDVCKTGAGGTPLKTKKEYYLNGNVPWLRSGEIDKKYIIGSELYITEEGLKNSSAKIFPENTVLIAMYGATAGQVGILKFPSSTNQAICGIYPNEKFIPEFLYYKFLEGKNELVKQAVGGAQPNISQIKIRNTLIPVLGIEEQKQIVRQLDHLQAVVQELEGVYRRKVEVLEEMKRSLLQKAFRGEL